MQHEIEYRSLDVIKPYHRNPRNNDNAIEAVKRSITDYGFNVPITVDTDGVIVTGHTRYRAARELGMDSVPVLTLDLPAAKITEYRIADNKTQELAVWDYDALIPELREIIDIEAFQSYFSNEDLQRLLDVDQGMGTLSEVTTKTIETRKTALDSKYDNVNQAQEDDIVEIPCPHCGESSFISASDVMSKLKK